MKVNCFLCGFTHLSCINEHKNRIRKSFIKANKFLKNGNQVLVHTSTETIFGTDSKNCTYKSLAIDNLKHCLSSNIECVSFMKTPSCAYISMHDCNNNVNYMYFKD